jgi:hypothetical protein
MAVGCGEETSGHVLTQKRNGGSMPTVGHRRRTVDVCAVLPVGSNLIPVRRLTGSTKLSARSRVMWWGGVWWAAGSTASCQAHSTKVRFSTNCGQASALRQLTRCAKSKFLQGSKGMVYSITVSLAGSRNWKTAPLGTSVKARSRPPCDSMMVRLTASPIPMPSGLVV